ncbi:RING-H2 finger A3A [Rhynchospora pubera]|uniref:RING-type E3 ubiquitin transferase n=1 Tax=Rhynchospora pubera TaxID=906938 RepID=A0AAV8C7H4_9POAL|nr:RING-H2 finger A3A [Rhynchospora pubera]
MASPPAAQPFHWHNDGSLDEKDFALHGHSIVLLLAILFILLLISLLYLYLRWTCYNYRLTTTAAATATTVASTEEGVDHASSGLDVGTITSMPVELYKEGENGECVICLGMFTVGEKLKVIPSCSHGFHPECIEAWLRTQPSCPLCRALVAKKTVADVKDMPIA